MQELRAGSWASEHDFCIHPASESGACPQGCCSHQNQCSECEENTRTADFRRKWWILLKKVSLGTMRGLDTSVNGVNESASRRVSESARASGPAFALRAFLKRGGLVVECMRNDCGLCAILGGAGWVGAFQADRRILRHWPARELLPRSQFPENVLTIRAGRRRHSFC